MDRVLEDVREIILKEMDDIAAKRELDENSLICVYKMVDIIKDITEIEEKESEMSMSSYSANGSYEYGNSYANRVGNGRSSRYNYARGNSSNRGGGYSRDGDVMDKLNRMMNEASSDTERDVIRRIMNNM